VKKGRPGTYRPALKIIPCDLVLLDLQPAVAEVQFGVEIAVASSRLIKNGSSFEPVCVCFCNNSISLVNDIGDEHGASVIGAGLFADGGGSGVVPSGS